MATAQTPVPAAKDSDPSALTTQQLWREVEHSNELALTRFEAMDKAISLLQAFADRSPTIAVVNAELGSLKELMTEKFSSIQTQFKERDSRIEQTAKDSKTAIDAALQAAEKSVAKQNENFSEANAKSEQSVTKEIDATKALIAANSKSTDDKITALDKRLTEMNGHSRGLSDGYGWLIAFIGMLFGGGGLIALLSK